MEEKDDDEDEYAPERFAKQLADYQVMRRSFIPKSVFWIWKLTVNYSPSKIAGIFF